MPAKKCAKKATTKSRLDIATKALGLLHSNNEILKWEKLKLEERLADTNRRLQLALQAPDRATDPLNSTDVAFLVFSLSGLFRALARATSTLSPATVTEIFDQEDAKVNEKWVRRTEWPVNYDEEDDLV